MLQQSATKEGGILCDTQATATTATTTITCSCILSHLSHFLYMVCGVRVLGSNTQGQDRDRDRDKEGSGRFSLTCSNCMFRVRNPDVDPIIRSSIIQQWSGSANVIGSSALVVFVLTRIKDGTKVITLKLISCP
jgi:hypothetical protein